MPAFKMSDALREMFDRAYYVHAKSFESKWACIEILVEETCRWHHIAADARLMREAIIARERSMSTGMEGGIAIPHCATPHIDRALVGVATLHPLLEFE